MLDEGIELEAEWEALKRGGWDALPPETREGLLDQMQQEYLTWPWWRWVAFRLGSERLSLWRRP